MNVLYSDGQNATLITATKSVSGALSDLRTLSQQLKVSGQTLLVLEGNIKELKLPPALAPQQVAAYLDAQEETLSITNPLQPLPTLVSQLPLDVVQSVKLAAKQARLRLTTVIPLTTLTLHAAGLPSSALILHLKQDGIFTALLSPVQVVTQVQDNKQRTTPEQIVKRLLTKPLASGDTPTVIFLHDQTDLDADLQGAEISPSLHLNLVDVLRQGLTLPKTSDLPADLNSPTLIVAGFRGATTETAPLPKPLIATGLAMLALNLGLFAAGQVLTAHNHRLEQQKEALTVQADEVQKLKAANDLLQQRHDQARTLMANKGPLADDLPLITGRALSNRATLSSLSGPDTAGDQDTQAFGQPVQRVYTLVALSPDPQNIAAAFTEAGLKADIRSIDCKTSPCQITLRAAPASHGQGSTP